LQYTPLNASASPARFLQLPEFDFGLVDIEADIADQVGIVRFRKAAAVAVRVRRSGAAV
jgi:hypothetical protein